jgi:prepilin-type N-terminal cleavage/methylation domain-containing protein
MKKTFNKGFTLIELLIVISIIGMLSSIVISSLSSARTKAKQVAAKGEMRRLTDTIQVAAGDAGVTLGFITPNNSLGTNNWTTVLVVHRRHNKRP